MKKILNWLKGLFFKTSVKKTDEPEWYTWVMANRETIFGNNAMPMAPWDELVTVYPDQLDNLGIYRLIFYHMGITIPWDMSKVYFPPFCDAEYGYIDLTAENAIQYAGMQGFDQLHDALLIICGINADAAGSTRENAQVAANLLYYAVTRACVGGNHSLELKLEQEIRNAPIERFPLLQDAVVFVFERCGLIHTSSVAYSHFEHPRTISRRME